MGAIAAVDAAVELASDVARVVEAIPTTIDLHFLGLPACLAPTS